MPNASSPNGGRPSGHAGLASQFAPDVDKHLVLDGGPTMKASSSSLPRAVDSIRVARHIVDTHSTALAPARRQDASLMVSELVTNALRHGRGAITLRITPSTEHLTIEVADEGHGTVEIAPAPGASGGWGLRIVDELADAWGAPAGSTRVWFRLLLDRP